MHPQLDLIGNLDRAHNGYLLAIVRGINPYARPHLGSRLYNRYKRKFSALNGMYVSALNGMYEREFIKRYTLLHRLGLIRHLADQIKLSK